MKNYVNVLGMVILLTLVSCDIADPNKDIQGTGAVVSMNVSLPTFTSIQSTGIADINVTRGETQEVTLSAQSEILEVMTQNVVNGKLILDFEENVNIKTTRGITIDITIPELTSISSEGTGDITLEGASQSDLEINLVGTGDIHAYDQEVGRCTILLTGTGSAWVNVTELLDIELTGTGNVYYKGTPQINMDITGTGGLISQNAYPRLDGLVKHNITI